MSEDRFPQALTHILQEIGCSGASVEKAPLPEYLVPMLEDPNAVDQVDYYKVTTTFGAFGLFMTVEGLTVDLTDLDLKVRDFADDAGEQANDFLVGVGSLTGLVMFLASLEQIRTGG